MTGVTATALAVSTLVTAPTASATYQGCSNDLVCFYRDYQSWLNSAPHYEYWGNLEKWKKFTPGTYDGYGSFGVRNEYANHSVLIQLMHLETDWPQTHCMPPKWTAHFGVPDIPADKGIVVLGVLVREESSCTGWP